MEKGFVTKQQTKSLSTLHAELLMKPDEYPYHPACHQQHRYTTDSLRIIGGRAEYRQIAVYIRIRVDAFVLMFGGKVDVDDCFRDTGGSRHDEVESSRHLLVHVDDC